MKSVVILDTNALLYDPKIIYTFPESLIIVPQTVLTELDKLKTTRASKEFLYRGREVSRTLFSLADVGNLSEGIELKDGSLLKVIALDKSKPLPSTLSAKNADDAILALTLQQIEEHGKDKVTLITNDLNMLLKAQTLEITVEQCPAIKRERLKAIWQSVVARKRLFLWAIVPIVLILAAIGIMAVLGVGPFESDLPPGIRSELRAYNEKEQAYLKLLEADPKDLNSLVGLGNLYFDNELFQLAANMYERAIRIDSGNTYVRTKLGESYLELGLTDIAIREFNRVLKDDPEHETAHYNLGIALWKGKGDLEGAKKEFQKCVELDPESRIAKEAKQKIEQIDEALQGEQ